MNATIEHLLAYMLFADEAPITDRIAGVSSFTDTFAARGPHDSRGRSLRDFDLRARLFRFPLSFMIYSDLFDRLPNAIRTPVYARLFDVLAAERDTGEFPHLSAADRRAILEIVRETKPDLPEYWLTDRRLNQGGSRK